MNYNLVEKFESFEKCYVDGFQCSIGIYPCKHLNFCAEKLRNDVEQAIVDKDVKTLQKIEKYMHRMMEFLDETQEKQTGIRDTYQMISNFFNPLKICCAKAWNGNCEQAINGTATCECKRL